MPKLSIDGTWFYLRGEELKGRNILFIIISFKVISKVHAFKYSWLIIILTVSGTQKYWFDIFIDYSPYKVIIKCMTYIPYAIHDCTLHLIYLPRSLDLLNLFPHSAPPSTTHWKASLVFSLYPWVCFWFIITTCFFYF